MLPDPNTLRVSMRDLRCSHVVCPVVPSGDIAREELISGGFERINEHRWRYHIHPLDRKGKKKCDKCHHLCMSVRAIVKWIIRKLLVENAKGKAVLCYLDFYKVMITLGMCEISASLPILTILPLSLLHHLFGYDTIYRY